MELQHKCARKHTRCDQFPDCNDFSDEEGCQVLSTLALVKNDEKGQWHQKVLSKLVVLPNNYSPDYAPFTVDKKGTLEKVPVQIRVSLKTFLGSPLKYCFRLTWSRSWKSMKLVKYLATSSASTWPGDLISFLPLKLRQIWVKNNFQVWFPFEPAQHEEEHQHEHTHQSWKGGEYSFTQFGFVGLMKLFIIRAFGCQS